MVPRERLSSEALLVGNDDLNSGEGLIDSAAAPEIEHRGKWRLIWLFVCSYLSTGMYIFSYGRVFLGNTYSESREQGSVLVEASQIYFSNEQLYCNNKMQQTMN